MKADTLKRSIQEAKRFIQVASAVEISRGKNFDRVNECCRASAACKRASMDLTRILADLRLNR